jgi:hypothetical protein
MVLFNLFPTGVVTSCSVKQQSDDVEAECIFPFTRNGVTYRACTSVGSNYPWCPTRLGVPDADGFWGFCGKECPFDPHEGICVILKKVRIAEDS